MAAGQGFKTFTTGEVLTAGDVNGYLMQGINVFTNATARDAAITAPAEGQFAFTKDNNSLWYYDGAAWVASGATGDIEGVTVTSPLTGGGTSGTVTVGILSGTTSNLGAVQLSDSTSSTSTTLAATANAVKSAYDIGNAAIPKSTVTTNGDLIYGTGSSTVTRRAIGSTGQVLTVSGGVPTWSTPAAAVPTNAVATVDTRQSTTSGTYTALATAGPAVTLTTGTKALIIQSAQLENDPGANTNIGFIAVAVSGATTIAATDTKRLSFQISAANYSQASFAYIITGLTAGSNTFTMQYRSQAGTPFFLHRTISVIDMGS
jgi:hypothetical protein